MRAKGVRGKQLPRARRRSALPPLRVNLFNEDRIERVVEITDPRVRFCLTYNEIMSGTTKRAAPA
jgi:hypothetical protein